MERLLGETLVEAGLISIDRIEIALLEQESQNSKLGEILASHGWLKKETADFFADKWEELIGEKSQRPLVYYFRKAGLLSEKQIKYLLEKQQEQEKKARFHHLVRKEGYLSQTTIDFFLTYLFDFNSKRPFSLKDSYKILKEYNEGKLDFQNSELYKAPFLEVTLHNINLSGSNLRRANFNSASLRNSSLEGVNLTRADLTQAILTQVNLQNADLRNANLKSADLRQANLQGANLKSADLRQANLQEANFAGADLSRARLDEKYTYLVYYNSETCFDRNFDPIRAGWTKEDS